MGGKCLSCISGHALLPTSNTCIKLTLALNCMRADPKGLCAQCQPTHTLTSNSNCVPRDPNCLKYIGGEC